MNEQIDKRKLLDIVVEIEIKTEKAQALIKLIKSFSDISKDDITLLDIINDYAVQILERTGVLSDSIRELL